MEILSNQFYPTSFWGHLSRKSNILIFGQSWPYKLLKIMKRTVKFKDLKIVDEFVVWTKQ